MLYEENTTIKENLSSLYNSISYIFVLYIITSISANTEFLKNIYYFILFYQQLCEGKNILTINVLCKVLYHVVSGFSYPHSISTFPYSILFTLYRKNAQRQGELAAAISPALWALECKRAGFGCITGRGANERGFAQARLCTIARSGRGRPGQRNAAASTASSSPTHPQLQCRATLEV